MADPDIVRIFDTTLRDGEQSPGASMTVNEKLQVADHLVSLGVDVIEAGFPAASPGDFSAVKEIANRCKGVAVAGLARANIQDIDLAWDAIKDAERPVLHIFIATSDIHLQYKLRKTREEVLEQVEAMVKYARALCPSVEFSAEDATRSDWEYLVKVFDVAIRADATVINVPDTVGYAMPHEYGRLIQYLHERVPGIEEVTVSAHCHDDLGMATANTIAGIHNGVRQVEVTINGLGERAGNTSLEEIVMAIKTRPEVFPNISTRINTEQIVSASQLVSQITGIQVQPNKAIVGANAFAHEAGIHQDGMLKNPLTYEIMTPESVGWAGTKLILGKHSGRHGFDARMRQLGYRLRAEALQEAYARFIAMTDEKKYVDDEDLIAIAAQIKVPVA